MIFSRVKIKLTWYFTGVYIINIQYQRCTYGNGAATFFFKVLGLVSGRTSHGLPDFLRYGTPLAWHELRVITQILSTRAFPFGVHACLLSRPQYFAVVDLSEVTWFIRLAYVTKWIDHEGLGESQRGTRGFMLVVNQIALRKFSSRITGENNVKQHAGDSCLPCIFLHDRTYNKQLRKEFNSHGSGPSCSKAG